ncbi:hypothetical protein F5X96DRAFT_632228 [Biscogniauxia mediterranea]|nr:hypothetical protein F5X96DRAFT_632228 [Biscogniauxia mediterranea]
MNLDMTLYNTGREKSYYRRHSAPRCLSIYRTSFYVDAIPSSSLALFFVSFSSMVQVEVLGDILLFFLLQFCLIILVCDQ